MKRPSSRTLMTSFKALGLASVVSIALAAGPSEAAQYNDPNFDAGALVTDPAYPAGAGPVIAIDEGHYNFHTMNGNFKAFTDLAVADGYTVQPITEFTAASLSNVDILVIANAVHPSNYNDPALFYTPATTKWKLPVASAFTQEEIEVLNDWVAGGGSLMLVADHFPWPRAMADLAKQFGFLLQNGYAFRSDFYELSLLTLLSTGKLNPSANVIDFHRQQGAGFTVPAGDGVLEQHPITFGRNAGEVVDRASTFTGQAFHAMVNVDVRPLMVMGKDAFQLYPSYADEFFYEAMATNFSVISTGYSNVHDLPVDGAMQAATVKHQDGRVAMFGEAAMFTAQINDSPAYEEPFYMGMNNPRAELNAQLALNTMHWLSGILKDNKGGICMGKNAPPPCAKVCKGSNGGGQ